LIDDAINGIFSKQKKLHEKSMQFFISGAEYGIRTSDANKRIYIQSPKTWLLCFWNLL